MVLRVFAIAGERTTITTLAHSTADPSSLFPLATGSGYWALTSTTSCGCCRSWSLTCDCGVVGIMVIVLRIEEVWLVAGDGALQRRQCRGEPDPTDPAVPASVQLPQLPPRRPAQRRRRKVHNPNSKNKAQVSPFFNWLIDWLIDWLKVRKYGKG